MILEGKISKTSKTGTGMGPPLFFKKEGQFGFRIIVPFRIYLPNAISRLLLFFKFLQLNFFNM